MNLTSKLSLLVIIGILSAISILGCYFDFFLEETFLEDAKNRILYGFQRLSNDLNTVTEELKEGISFVRTDENFLASVELINDSQDKKHYNAILLDEEYYAWIQEGRGSLHGISFVTPKHIIPLKARAWLDLRARKEAGESIGSKDIKKHRNDVFRLFPALSPEPVGQVSAAIKEDLQNFLAAMDGEEIDLKAFGLGRWTRAEILENLATIYGI